MIKCLLKIFVILPVLCALCLCAQAAQVLEDGASGETVMVLTRRLVELGYMDESVSEYDERVISAIGDFQTANGLARTGVADIETQQAMNSGKAVTRQEYIMRFSVRYDGRTLTTGSSGEEVRQMQAVLYELGYYKYEPDGKFGEATRRAVANFQRAHGLEDTGIADESVFIRLYEGEPVPYSDYVTSRCAVRGENGMHVRAIQVRLIELGYYSGEVSGTYGENTSRAVSRFQYDNGINQSGNVDTETYEALFSYNAQPAEDDGSLYPGDSGDDVRAMQERLAELGYFSGNADGIYDRETETAVMLFRAANGMEISENACLDMLGLLYSVAPNDAAWFETTSVTVDSDDISLVCGYAESLKSMPFAEESEYYGLSFVRYLYAHCGVHIGDPDEAIEGMGSAQDTVTDIAQGDIIVLRSEKDGEIRFSFALCIGGGNIARVNDITGAVEIIPFAGLDYTHIHVWEVGR